MGKLIRWSGSKSYLTKEIISYFPKKFDIYYEPFLGSGSVFLDFNPKKAVVNDIDINLIKLWLEFKTNGINLIKEYKILRRRFIKNRNFYYKVRNRFNKLKKTVDFYFLTRTCYNALIRYNSKGEFNSPIHFSRNGMNPNMIYEEYFQTLSLIKRSSFLNLDYKEALKTVTQKDFIFFDPPYAEIKKNSLYLKNFDTENFHSFLKQLNEKKIKWALTYGEKEIPEEIYKHNIKLKEMDSQFRKLKKINYKTIENLYLNYDIKIIKNKSLTDYL